MAPVKTVVHMPRRCEAGLLSFKQEKISDTCSEGFNGAIQLTKANARGFRKFTTCRAKILFHCCKLDLA